MAEPKTAFTVGEGGPMSATRVIQVNADGSVAAGDFVAFILWEIGKIQFEVAAGLPAGVTAVFTPPMFGDPTSGSQTIYQNNTQNVPFGPNNQQVNLISSYMITGPGISQGPYCITIGGAYMRINVDAGGDLTPQLTRIPNSGLISFNAAAAISFETTPSGGGTNPFKNPLTLPQGVSVVHANGSDCSVTLTPQGPVANPPATIKIGSGGGSPMPGHKPK